VNWRRKIRGGGGGGGGRGGEAEEEDDAEEDSTSVEFFFPITPLPWAAAWRYQASACARLCGTPWQAGH